MGKSVFNPSCKKTKYYDVEKINFDQNLNSGTAHLISKCDNLLLIWSIKNYPTEEQLPGAPYPIKVEFTIFKKHNHHFKSLKSMTGEFVFELNSGTLPQFNLMGLPDGEYQCVARLNNKDYYKYVIISLIDGSYEVIID
jgi:hypothetical protein